MGWIKQSAIIIPAQLPSWTLNCEIKWAWWISTIKSMWYQIFLGTLFGKLSPLWISRLRQPWHGCCATDNFILVEVYEYIPMYFCGCEVNNQAACEGRGESDCHPIYQLTSRRMLAVCLSSISQGCSRKNQCRPLQRGRDSQELPSCPKFTTSPSSIHFLSFLKFWRLNKALSWTVLYHQANGHLTHTITLTDETPTWASSSPGWTVQAFSASPHRRIIVVALCQTLSNTPMSLLCWEPQTRCSTPSTASLLLNRDERSPLLTC